MFVIKIWTDKSHLKGKTYDSNGSSYEPFPLTQLCFLLTVFPVETGLEVGHGIVGCEEEGEA